MVCYYIFLTPKKFHFCLLIHLTVSAVWHSMPNHYCFTSVTFSPDTLLDLIRHMLSWKLCSIAIFKKSSVYRIGDVNLNEGSKCVK